MVIYKTSQENLTRRELLKRAGRSALLVSGALSLPYVLSGCATVSHKEEGPVIYPPLKGQKVQPPESGCYIGFFGAGDDAEYYESQIGMKPKIMVPSFMTVRNARRFPRDTVHKISSAGVIPFIFKELTIDIRNYGFANLTKNSEFREVMKQYAKDVVAFGKPLFVCTMREMNSTYHPHITPWSSKPAKKTNEVWRYIWQIFEDTGANEYATWVWEVIPPETNPRKVRRPEPFYPGDKYVDWIGLSAHSEHGKGLSSLASVTYTAMRRNHPDKPIMMAEFGTIKDYNQPRWIRKAFEWIKSNPGMKSAHLWDALRYHIGEIKRNKNLSPESYELLEEILQDPYFIGVR
jgi:hypothetical protein